MLLIKNGNIHNAIQPEPFKGDILCADGKITEIAPNIEATPDMTVVDASRLQVYPGFVEAHSHMGLHGYGIGYEGSDYNEMGDIITPHLRSIDGFKPGQPDLYDAAKAGVTTINSGPGSSNVIGGTFAAYKTVGHRVDDMLVKDNTAMKCAFGENPKRCYREKGNTARMTTAARLREVLFKTQEYLNKKEAAGEDVSKLPPFDMKLEAMIPVIKGKMPLKAHAHAQEDIFTAIRIAKEFGIKLTLEHVTEGHMITEDLAKEGCPVAIGPSLTSASKFELRNKTFDTPGILDKAGLQVSIITDAPVIPQEYLALCAALAVKSGMDPFKALQAITINPAHHIGIADRVGSLEIGKDADIILFDGDPFAVSTKAVQVFILGKPVE
ncbi:MAG: amidohydrolase [Christensenellales bacterium]